MRFVPGGTLAGVMKTRGKPFAPRDAAMIVRKIALGVAAAHAGNVIHRDLKPANVLWDGAGREVLVTDFGLARIGDETRLTVEGTVMGTPLYMAPEQISGDIAAVGPLADVYALGVILFELLTGSYPFRGTLHEVIAQKLAGDITLPSTMQHGIDPAMDAICVKAMWRSPESRFASAKDLAAALADYRRGTGAEPAVAGPVPRVFQSQPDPQEVVKRESVGLPEHCEKAPVEEGVFDRLDEEDDDSRVAQMKRRYRTKKDAKAKRILLIRLALVAVLALACIVVWYRIHLREKKRAEFEQVASGLSERFGGALAANDSAIREIDALRMDRNLAGSRNRAQKAIVATDEAHKALVKELQDLNGKVVPGAESRIAEFEQKLTELRDSRRQFTAVLDELGTIPNQPPPPVVPANSSPSKDTSGFKSKTKLP